MLKKLFALLLLLMMVFCLAACEDEGTDSGDGDSSSSKEELIESQTNTRADQEVDADSVTILVYMIASDLESQSGCATADIEEMYSAKLSDNVHIILQTGGTKYWANDIMDKSQVERYEVVKKGVKKVGTVGKCKKVNMADPNTLADFISWGMKKYPADRYGVILWNHGGGFIGGYGQDEYHEEDTLDLKEIGNAFKKAKAKVDFVGFDACLMGTIETAYVMSDYADYMIASEETEPGSGWFYTDWISMLAENPGVSMKALAKELIHDFVEGEDSSFWDDMTLALYDLKDAKSAYKALCNYMKQSRTVLKKQGYEQLADARIDTRSYGDDEYEQVDIRSYMEKDGIEDENLEEILGDMIVYYQGNIADSTGMAMYYPYSYLDYYSEMSEFLKKIGMNDKDYLGYFNDFVSVLAKGQNMNESTAGSSSFLEQLLGIDEETDDTNYEEEDWYDEDAADCGYNSDALFTTDEELTFTETKDGLILDLTDEQWESIAKVEMELYLCDKNGYQYFGKDSLVDYNKNGDLIADFDMDWVCINDQFVPFYIISDVEDGSNWQATGYSPAVLNEGTKNEKDINLFIRWDNKHEEGYVMGYSVNTGDNEGISLAQKKYISLKKGDKLDFYCDYYTNDGEYEETYYIGDTIKVTNTDLTVSYNTLDEDGIRIGYHLVDKYQNEYWTELLEFE